MRTPCSAGFDLDVRSDPPRLTLRLHGALDVGSVSRLTVPTEADLRSISEVVIDLSALDFCDVAGLERLDGIAERVSGTGRQVRITGSRPFFRKIARITGLLQKSLGESSAT